MTHETLANYLETNFAVMHHHGWDADYFESITPFERGIYVTLLNEHMRDLAEQRRLAQRQAAAATRFD